MKFSAAVIRFMFPLCIMNSCSDTVCKYSYIPVDAIKKYTGVRAYCLRVLTYFNHNFENYLYPLLHRDSCCMPCLFHTASQLTELADFVGVYMWYTHGNYTELSIDNNWFLYVNVMNE